MQYVSQVSDWLLTRKKNTVLYDELIVKSIKLVKDPLLAIAGISFLFWQDVAEIPSRNKTSVLASKMRPLLDSSAKDIHGITYHFWGYFARTILGYPGILLYSASLVHEGLYYEDWQDHEADRLGILAGLKVLDFYKENKTCPKGY